ncbi:unnamed protein product, partial [Didymodactylos carnosus]
MVIYETAFDELSDWLIAILYNCFDESYSREIHTFAEFSKQTYNTVNRTLYNYKDEKPVRNLYVYVEVRIRLNEDFCMAGKKNVYGIVCEQSSLENRFDNLLHFETSSDKEGTYVSFNGLSAYIKLSVSKAKDVPYSVLENIPSAIISTDNRDSECLFSAIRIMRKFISIDHRALKTLGDKTEKLVSFICDDFWTCAPLLLRNFIGLVTLNDDDFQKIQRHFDFYNIFMQDMFEKSSNWLKICSITYDVLNCKNDQFISPTHSMLANELLQHEDRLIWCQSLIDMATHARIKPWLNYIRKKKPKLLYQSTKAVLQKYLQEKFSMAFLESPNWALHPHESALIIDGGLLLQQLPARVPKKTVADYGAVLLEWFIKDQFKKRDGIDIIFDSSDSKRLKQFIERH